MVEAVARSLLFARFSSYMSCRLLKTNLDSAAVARISIGLLMIENRSLAGWSPTVGSIFVRSCPMELEVHIPVTAGAKCYQIFESIVSQSAPGLNVMNLEILRRSAVLAPPAVSLEDLFAKFAVSLSIESKAPSLLTQGAHEAFCSLSRKVTFIGPGNSSNIRLKRPREVKPGENESSAYSRRREPGSRPVWKK